MTYYDILEVSETASTEVIQMAYKALAKKYHPDLFKGDPTFAEEQMKRINAAYHILSNPEERMKYDAFLRWKRSQTQEIHNEASSKNSEAKETKEKPKKQKKVKTKETSTTWETVSGKRSAVIIVVLSLLLYGSLGSSYIGNGISSDYSYWLAIIDFSLVCLIVMSVPMLIGAIKTEFPFHSIKRIATINSIATLVVSLILFVCKVTPQPFLGSLGVIFFYFINKHVLIQMRQRIRQRKHRIITVCIVMLVLLLACVSVTFGIRANMDYEYESNHRKPNSQLIPSPEPNSGTILAGSEDLYGSEITVAASSGNSCVVKLKTASGVTRLSFYVRAGDTATVGVPRERLYVYFASGDTWYGQYHLFGENTSYSWDDQICFFTNYTYEYTLSPVTNGNFSQTPIDADDF